MQLALREVATGHSGGYVIFFFPFNLALNTIVLIKSQTFYLVISVEPNSVLGDSNTHIVKVRSRNRQGREKRKRKIQVISRMLGSSQIF